MRNSQLFMIAELAHAQFSVVVFLISAMAGVQSFVAQRYQNHQSPSREKLGTQHRVPVPRTKLSKLEEKPLFKGPGAIQTTGPPVTGHSTHGSEQQSTERSVVHRGFDTNAEDFNNTATISTGGSSRCYQGEEDNCDRRSSRYVADNTMDAVPEAQAPFRHRQQRTHHIERSRQLDTMNSAGRADEGNFPESPDEDSDEEELIHDGILQDLNSPEFSHYFQGQTFDMTRAAFQPIVAAPGAHSSLVVRNAVQHSQKAATPSRPTGNGIGSGAADPSIKIQLADYLAHEMVMRKSLGVPVQKVQGSPMEQLPLSVLHQSSSQQPSVTFQQTWRPIEVGRDTKATYSQPQVHEDEPLSAQKGSIDFGAPDSSVAWDLYLDSRRTKTRESTKNLDYSPEQMSSMTFEQLSNEPFDIASDTARPSILQEISSSTLAAKMTYILEKFKDDEDKFVQRRAFFSSLPIDQYEECANLIIGNLSAIISKFTDARQQRRRVAKDFEEEVAKREGRVRGKTTIMRRNLGRLKRGGEEVVRSATS